MSDRLAEIKARVDAATPGPWEERAQDDSRCMAYSSIWAVAPGRPAVEIVATDWNDDGYPQPVQADCDLIAHAPADIAYLLEQLAAQTARLTALERACYQEVPEGGPHTFSGFGCLLCGWDCSPEFTEMHEPSCLLYAQAGGEVGA